MEKLSIKPKGLVYASTKQEQEVSIIVKISRKFDLK